MSEWWTYRLSDFLLFSSRTYNRLFELYHRDIWPLQVLAILGGVFMLLLLLRAQARHGRVIASFLAAAWLWVALAFHLQRYAKINWAASWFAGLFLLEALLLLWHGVIRDRLRLVPITHRAQWLGIALFVFALLIQPFVSVLSGRAWTQTELFGLTPDATAVGTLGVILVAGARVRLSLLFIPLLWCVVSGATLWTMKSPDAFVLLAAASLALVRAAWMIATSRRVRGTSTHVRSD